MSVPILAVDKDISVWEREKHAWQRHGTDLVRVDFMRDAIEHLSRTTFLFVSINADNISYLPLLPLMREMTEIPLFVITSNFTINGQVQALREGADVYASFQENVEDNIRSALALLHQHTRQKNQHSKPPVLCRDLLIDIERHEAFMGENKLDLTPIEFKILLFLAKNQGKPISKERIYSFVWNEDNCLDVDSAVSFHIHNLRQKLGGGYIVTVWGIGFKIE